MNRDKINQSIFVIFIVNTTFAMLLYDEYDIMNQFLSALGVGRTGLLFNSGLFLLGIASLLIFDPRIFLKAVFIEEANKFLKYTVLVLGIISAIQIFGIAIFISDGDTSKTHDMFAISFFLLLLPLTLALAILSKKDRNTSMLFVLGFVSTFIGLFLPVNQYIFQKIIVLIYINGLYRLSDKISK